MGPAHCTSQLLRLVSARAPAESALHQDAGEIQQPAPAVGGFDWCRSLLHEAGSDLVARAVRPIWDSVGVWTARDELDRQKRSGGTSCGVRVGASCGPESDPPEAPAPARSVDDLW